MIWYFVTLSAGMLLLGCAMWGYLVFVLRVDKEATLAARAVRIQKYLTSRSGLGLATALDDLDGILWTFPEGRMTQLFDSHGVRLVPIDRHPRDLPWPNHGLDECFGRMTVGGQRYWTISTPAVIGNTPVRINVASQYEDNYALLDRIRIGLLAALPLILLVSTSGGWILSGRALSPMRQLADAAHSIGVQDLSKRLPIPDTDDELQRIAESFDGLLVRLESALGRQRQFTSDASHDLRTPLTIARTTAEVALRSDFPGDGMQALVDVLSELSEMERILDDMLLLARLEGSSYEMPLHSMSVAAELSKVFARLEPLATERQLTFTIETTVGEDACIVANAEAIRRILGGVLDNSLKYTPAGGFVRLESFLTETHLVYRVKDSGIGIPEAALPHIFERFFRADAARFIDKGGSGLGLAIAKWMVERHGGSIEAQSTIGQGTLISISLPIDPVV